MTAIEFFEQSPIDNIISTLTATPDKIIFIGDRKVMERFAPVYQRFTDGRGLHIQTERRSVNRNSVASIVALLSEIVEAEEHCLFDLTGGDDLVLVAVGIVYERYRDKHIELQRFNVRTGSMLDCDGDGLTRKGAEKPAITVEENIALHGGSICYGDMGPLVTYRWQLTPDFIEDVQRMWRICKENPNQWNSHLNVLEAMDAFARVDRPLEVNVDISALQGYMGCNGLRYVEVCDLLPRLEQVGLIRGYQEDAETITFVYKNAQVRRCLTKAGNTLELTVLATAAAQKNKDGTPVYTDAMCGVNIDWDGELHGAADDEKDTHNEIDVVLMRGLVPVFISCKNGQVEPEELYKLDAVAERFGGAYVKKVMVATYVSKSEDKLASFRQRAEDMKIKLIDQVHEMPDDIFARELRQLLG